MTLPLAGGKYPEAAKKVSVFLGFLALAVWLFHLYVWYRFDGSRPSQPDRLSGRIYALNTHGHIVFLSRDENRELAGLTIAAVSLFGVAVVIDGLFGDGCASPKKSWEKR
jgi:hypothetical protein